MFLRCDTIDSLSSTPFDFCSLVQGNPSARWWPAICHPHCIDIDSVHVGHIWYGSPDIGVPTNKRSEGSQATANKCKPLGARADCHFTHRTETTSRYDSSIIQQVHGKVENHVKHINCIYTGIPMFIPSVGAPQCQGIHAHTFLFEHVFFSRTSHVSLWLRYPVFVVFFFIHKS